MENKSSQQRLMDTIYRYQKHIYDPLRKLVLPGRDKIIEMFHLQGNERIVEIGCGTARNLIKIAKKFPSVTLHGIDVSEEMLKLAKRKSRHFRNIHLHHSLAEEFDYQKLDFDIAFFSYSLTMIPNWKMVMDRVMENAHPGAKIFMVDFYDQAGLPRWVRFLLLKWFGLFHVKFEPELIAHLHFKAAQKVITLELFPIYRGYSYIAELIKR